MAGERSKETYFGRRFFELEEGDGRGFEKEVVNWIMPIRLIFLLFTVICFSCTPDRNKIIAKDKAQKLIASLSPTRLKDLSHWNYAERGELKFWYYDSSDTQSCVTTIEERNDSSILKVVQAGNFLRIFPPRFPAHLNSDTIIVIKHGENWNLIAKYANDSSYNTKIPNPNLAFEDRNPLYLFKDMNWFDRSFNIKGISSNSSIGNFVQFYLGEGYILTYFPDLLFINPKVKEYWEKDFKTGEALNKNWNLRKWQQSE
jgi:hypothetical protein